MQLFAWRTGAIRGYRQGTVAVTAPDVETARSMILGDFDRWIKSGHDESSPMASQMDTKFKDAEGYPEWWEEHDREEFLVERAAILEELTADLAKDPLPLGPAGVLYMWGGD